MLKNLLRITLVGYIWTRYKTAVVSTVVLVAYFFLVGKIHEDFVNYGQLSDNTGSIGLSFVVKWVAILTGIIIYIALNVFSGKSSVDSGSKDTSLLTPVEKYSRTKSTVDKDDTHIDPFETIRKKDKLKSKADFVIEQKSK